LTALSPITERLLSNDIRPLAGSARPVTDMVQARPNTV